jgi:hypothetical protein
VASRSGAEELGGVFTDATYYRGPPLTDAAIDAAEAALGRRLPATYVQLLRVQNGGSLVKRCVATPYATSWAPDHIEVTALFGIGGERGIDTEFGSDYLVREWGYPPVGVVIADMPSGGHDAVMLDYSDERSDEPAVVYVDEDRVPRPLADTFGEFLAVLRDCDEFDVPE